VKVQLIAISRWADGGAEQDEDGTWFATDALRFHCGGLGIATLLCCSERPVRRALTA
jgi:hypothetical protein